MNKELIDKEKKMESIRQEIIDGINNGSFRIRNAYWSEKSIDGIFYEQIYRVHEDDKKEYDIDEIKHDEVYMAINVKSGCEDTYLININEDYDLSYIPALSEAQINKYCGYYGYSGKFEYAYLHNVLREIIEGGMPHFYAFRAVFFAELYNLDIEGMDYDVAFDFIMHVQNGLTADVAYTYLCL